MTTEIAPNLSDGVSLSIKLDESKEKLNDHVFLLSAVANNKFPDPDFNRKESMDESEQFIDAMGAEGCVQKMLAAQMLSIHRMQQISVNESLSSRNNANKQYYTNAVVKLSNAFVQQASLLAKLQGHSNQKIIVEHVDVHSGGQAIVGNVLGVKGSQDKK
ncbi:MAG: hypothetical protein Q8L78_04385 [Coxiellaceae bacterium]|nr:hypothetical protein [Coxiellaceae bacterium]